MRRNVRTLAIILAVALGATTLGLVASDASVPAVVRIHLGTDGRYISYGSTTQPLTTPKNNCVINSAETVLALTSTGTQSKPGLGADSIGVKGTPSSGNGTPCGQIDSSESLTLTPGSSISGRTFTALRFDLEMTGNALVRLTLSSATRSQLYRLQTGTSISADQMAEAGYDTTAPYTVSSSPGDVVDACAAPNSSGPNNSSNDNCEWSVNPGFEFDHVTLTTASSGSVSLEGSNDFGDDPNHDSLLYTSNAAPTANDDTVTTDEDTAATGNVLTNDTDPDGNTLSASLVTDVAHGTLSLGSDGAFTYTPASNYNGTDSFVYSASDGALSDTATVNITVNPVNDPPVAVDDSGEVDQHSFADIDVVANDTDIDSATLTPSNIGDISPAGSTAVVNAGKVRFTPPDTYTGPASFTYKASDGSATSNTATVSLTVVPTMCSNDTVTADDGDVSGSFTRLTDGAPCKRYELAASAEDGTVLFQPHGSSTVDYRAFVSFGPEPAPSQPGPGTFTLSLRYDPAGGTNYKPVQWCGDPQFDNPGPSGLVTSATMPDGETWCIASESTQGASGGNVATTWQLFGQDDPKFVR
jgi:VCBS repeat-containing protein